MSSLFTILLHIYTSNVCFTIHAFPMDIVHAMPPNLILPTFYCLHKCFCSRRNQQRQLERAPLLQPGVRFFIVLTYLHWQQFYKQLLKTTNWPLCVRCSASLVVLLSSEISCVKNRSNHSASAASQPRVSFPKLGAEIRNYCGKNGDGDDGDGDGDGGGDSNYTSFSR